MPIASRMARMAMVIMSSSRVKPCGALVGLFVRGMGGSLCCMGLFNV